MYSRYSFNCKTNWNKPGCQPAGDVATLVLSARRVLRGKGGERSWGVTGGLSRRLTLAELQIALSGSTHACRACLCLSLSHIHTHSWQASSLAVLYFSSMPCSVSGAISVVWQCPIFSVNLFHTNTHKHLTSSFFTPALVFCSARPYLEYALHLLGSDALYFAAGDVWWRIREKSTRQMHTIAETHMNREKGNHVLHNITHSMTKGIKIAALPGSSTTLKQSGEVLPERDECVHCVCVRWGYSEM